MLSYIWKRLRSEERGFTLIELLIVILILGILAAIAIFAAEPFRARAAQACIDANERIHFTGGVAAELLDVDESVLYEFESGDCGTGGGGGGGGSGGTFGALTNTWTATGASGTVSVELNPPTAGNLLVAFVSHRGAPTASPPTVTQAGWTMRGIQQSSGGGNANIAVFTKLAAGGTETITVNWDAAGPNIIVREFSVPSGATLTFATAVTSSSGDPSTSNSVSGVSGGANQSLVIAGIGLRPPYPRQPSWAGVGSAAHLEPVGGTVNLHLSMAHSLQSSGTGPFTVTATFASGANTSLIAFVVTRS